MSALPAVNVLSVGARTPLGLSALQVAMSLRARLFEPRSTVHKDRRGFLIGASRSPGLSDELFGFDVEEIKGASRRRPLVTARQIAMYVFRELTDLSYPAIAREFGGRDHTTVIHAVDKIGTLMRERRQIYEQVTELIQMIKSSD